MKFHLVGGVEHAFKKELHTRLAQVLMVTVLLGTIPVQAYAEDEKPVLLPYSVENAQLVFNRDSADPVLLAQADTITIKIGESRAQETARIKREAAARKARTSVTLTISAPIKTSNPSFEAKRALAQRAAAAYNVPWELVEAVWQIESGKSWDTSVRSYAGAQGPAQFMPATWRRYGVDANGDGVANIHSAEDAVHSAANYLAANGANRGEYRRALFAYNHAEWYVNKVLNLAREIGFQG